MNASVPYRNAVRYNQRLRIMRYMRQQNAGRGKPTPSRYERVARARVSGCLTANDNDTDRHQAG